MKRFALFCYRKGKAHPDTDSVGVTPEPEPEPEPEHRPTLLPAATPPAAVQRRRSLLHPFHSHPATAAATAVAVCAGPASGARPPPLVLPAAGCLPPPPAIEIITPVNEHACTLTTLGHCWGCQAHRQGRCRIAEVRASDYNRVLTDWQVLEAAAHIATIHDARLPPAKAEGQLLALLPHLWAEHRRRIQSGAWTWRDPLELMVWATRIDELELRRLIASSAGAEPGHRCDSCLRIFLAQIEIEANRMWRKRDGWWREEGWGKPPASDGGGDGGGEGDGEGDPDDGPDDGRVATADAAGGPAPEIVWPDAEAPAPEQQEA